MKSADNQTLTALSDEQTERLVAIVLEDFGPDLSRTQFNNAVLMLLEDIAGFELMNRCQQGEHVRNAWIVYRRLIASNRSH